jgi:threonine synthase
MKYVSTRGAAPVLGFADVTLAGLADDGGLYVPENCPRLTPQDLQEMAAAPYADNAARIIAPFAGMDFPDAVLKKIVRDAYAVFDHADIAPLKQLRDGLYVLELFHGPTLAFKDVALQFLGHLFDYILDRRGEKVTIVGATSGDTGSAAIEAFRGKKNVNIVILHPHNRVSEVQRRQMTTVLDDNVFNLAVDGTFDDCQDMVKAMFADRPFRDAIRMSAVNSINWARIVAQTVYYLHAGTRVMAQTGRAPAFVVPTGNFGNVFAGYIAGQMGMPHDKFVVATNRNDILHRFFETAAMTMAPAHPSISPSMDIQISSNFERLLFDLCARDGTRVAEMMRGFRADGKFNVDPQVMMPLRDTFASGRLDDDATLAVIRKTYETDGYIVDPHTAVGIGVAHDFMARNPDVPVITLATAHPAKFPDAVRQATGITPALPDRLSDLFTREERYTAIANDLSAVQDFIRVHVKL